VPAGEVYSFVDDGVVGDAVEVKNLVQPEAQENLDERLLAAAVGFLLDEPVERGLAADGAEHELLTQAAVGAGEARQGIGEQGIGGAIAAFPFAQNSDSDFSWSFCRHAGTIAGYRLSREPIHGAERCLGT